MRNETCALKIHQALCAICKMDVFLNGMIDWITYIEVMNCRFEIKLILEVVK